MFYLTDDAHDAAQTLEAAALSAVGSRHEAIETRARIDLTRALADDLQPSAGREAAREARACLTREGKNDQELARLLLAEASVAYDESKYTEAREECEQALEIRGRILPPDDPEIAAALNQLGVVEIIIQ